MSITKILITRIMHKNNNILRWIILLVIIIFIIGMIGFHYIFDKIWTDSFYLTALTMSSLSLETKPKTNSEKIFIGIFTMISIGMYLVLITVLIGTYLVLKIGQ